VGTSEKIGIAHWSGDGKMLHSKKHLFFAKIIDIFPNLPLIAIIWYF
jgi:hypothetical protein